MSYNQIYAIASQSMEIEKMRVDLVAQNIANQQTIQKEGSPLYQAATLVRESSSFDTFLEGKAASLEELIEIVPQNLPVNKVYQPGHPAADNKGFVTYPGLSFVDEMTTLLKASRNYEAHIKIINTAHNLFIQSLSIGDER